MTKLELYQMNHAYSVNNTDTGDLIFSPILPENLGDPSFKKGHGLSYNYVAGAMANGIASVELVVEMAKAGYLAFFGSAGLSLERIENSIIELKNQLSDKTFGVNLIHSPHEPNVEMGTVELFLKHQVKLVSASAFLNLTLPIVYYRLKGIHLDEHSIVVSPNKVIAKVSRVEVAKRFFGSAPQKMVRQLLEMGKITEEEAQLSDQIPMAEDITAEADSGGHTDNRPALTLFPTMIELKNEMTEKYWKDSPFNLRVGLAGGISTPSSVVAAFSMGAAYVLTGTVNQSCVEAGTSMPVRKLLASLGQADVTMAPAADMFEMGVKVQVVKRGTMFSVRGQKLYNYYQKYESLDAIPEELKLELEKNIFHRSLTEEWKNTRKYFLERNPKQVELAEKDPKHKMALVFRSYLGQGSVWANRGVENRKFDYQIWCGPSMGAFNQWVKGSYLESIENRKVVDIAVNLMFGACVLSRVNQLKLHGVEVSSDLQNYKPMSLGKINEFTL